MRQLFYILHGKMTSKRELNKNSKIEETDFISELAYLDIFLVLLYIASITCFILLLKILFF